MVLLQQHGLGTKAAWPILLITQLTFMADVRQSNLNEATVKRTNSGYCWQENKDKRELCKKEVRSPPQA